MTKYNYSAIPPLTISSVQTASASGLPGKSYYSTSMVTAASTTSMSGDGFTVYMCGIPECTTWGGPDNAPEVIKRFKIALTLTRKMYICSAHTEQEIKAFLFNEKLKQEVEDYARQV